MNGTRVRSLGPVAAFLLVGWMTASQVSQAPPTPPTRLGQITSVRPKSGGFLAEVKIRPGDKSEVGSLKFGPVEVKAGMSVRLVFSLGTALFRMPVGRVQSVDTPGQVCLVMVDQALLNLAVENPSTGESHQVGEFLKPGAEVAISKEPLGHDRPGELVPD